jgi:hypothetical protein
MADFNTWRNAVLGVSLNIDGAFGAQCVDVDLSWGLACFPGVGWPTLFPPVGGAKDMYEKYNPNYWTRVENDHNNPSQVPPQGAVAIFAASPEPGYTSVYSNPDGHTGVVDHTDANFIYLVQQDGSTGQAVTRLSPRPWRYTKLKGWLVPKTSVSTPPPLPIPPSGGKDPRIGKVLYLHPVLSWRIYRVGEKPAGINAIGFLRPSAYDSGLPAPKNRGLTYTIVGVSQYPNTVTIRTNTYGLVDIYVDSDGEII